MHHDVLVNEIQREKTWSARHTTTPHAPQYTFIWSSRIVPKGILRGNTLFLHPNFASYFRCGITHLRTVWCGVVVVVVAVVVVVVVCVCVCVFAFAFFS